ncbi:Golgi apparatus membrane protein TVP23 [Rhizoctonia solani AG-1 IB]|uniref:Golgi apparatus membrane protein TVP23 n=1 Tax=Thanatephorus cucumeris (strain AG1-IB / isolate 7/3/14) TaxID=1108050 RepID=M5BMD2_THACB|nr:Golgi apparatus membrane protein TVP23 [Rhizoctonia solani AG-1 IB]
MSTTDPLLTTIEPDEVAAVENAPNARTQPQREQVVLTPTNRVQGNASASDMEAGISGILRQSSHPSVLFFLYLFRIAAIAVYLLCGFFTDNYVLSTVVVVVLLAMDFWNCRNVAGRRLVGLRFWNQVDEDGESYWVFESRDPSRPANPIDSKMFWTALYVFPVLWVLLFIVSLLKFNISFVPIVGLALVFNITNVIGFTYADRDAKQRWASSVAADGWNMGLGGLGGRILEGAVRNSVGRAFGM